MQKNKLIQIAAVAILAIMAAGVVRQKMVYW